MNYSIYAYLKTTLRADTERVVFIAGTLLATLLASIFATVQVVGLSTELLKITVFAQHSDHQAPSSTPQKSKREIAQHIASQWLVNKNTALDLVTYAHTAAKQNKVDPLLVLAIIAKESSFVHFGNAGDLTISKETQEVLDPLLPHGPMQVSGRWHPEKMPRRKTGEIRATTIEENITAGTRVIAIYVAKENGNLVRALQRYNGNLGDKDARYAKAVLRIQEKLKSTS